VIKKNRYSILSILSPFLGVGLIVIGISDNMILAPLSLLIGVILGFALAVVSLFKKEKKLLSFIALVINTVIIVFGPDRFF
tara:strand:+ start:187 stop:429 length:243 start_codon:yes stop_codon:yes gene_type:complete